LQLKAETPRSLNSSRKTADLKLLGTVTGFACKIPFLSRNAILSFLYTPSGLLLYPPASRNAKLPF